MSDIVDKLIERLQEIRGKAKKEKVKRELKKVPGKLVDKRKEVKGKETYAEKGRKTRKSINKRRRAQEEALRMLDS